ncbi:MAG: carboxypeptidase regulatory-like domain-containing protein, partial [Acidobacteriota bacterium]|nr:carboxypeptidase regulatory-like domain-containing protein [Acidobacteriota bacterium]
MKILRICLALALLAALSTSVSYAQAVNATLLGNVTDSSGAAVPAAKVTVTEMQTGSGRSMETNDSG